MKKNTLFLALCAIFYLMANQNTYAIKAFSGPIVVTQPDGSTLVTRVHGDEFNHYQTTEDGYLVKQNSKGYFTYAVVNSDGTSSVSTLTAKDAKKRSAQENTFLKTVSKPENIQLIRSTTRRSAISAANKAKGIQKAYPLNGSPKALVILVNFSDKSFVTATPKTAFTNLLNESGYSANDGTGSAKDYFMASSLGKFAPNFDVVGPYTLPNNMAYYGANDATYDQDVKPEYMIADACTAANNAGLDFAQYDTDNDGILDNVFVYYAGYNEAEGGAATTIWPHRWSLNDAGYSGNRTFDGKTLNDYACTSELSGAAGSDMCGIGTFCHEFGHVLGMPDYYHTDDSNNNTLNEWSIMDYGGYSNNGKTPPLYSAYDRFYLGWLTPQEVNTPTDLTLLPIYQGITTPANTNQQAYLISATAHNLNGAAPSPTEFFMVEYRKKTGWDLFLPGEGMLIWHIDYLKSEWDANTPNNYTGTSQTASSHMRVYLQPLSGSSTTPGSAFTTGSYTPTTWSGTNINRAITSITKTADNITFKLMGGTQGPTITTTGSLTEFSTVAGTPAAAQSFTVSGLSLTSDVTLSLADQTNFDIKLSTESTWSKSLTITQTAGVVNSASINVRYNPTTAGSHSTTLTLSSTGATSKTLNLTGIASVPFDPNAPNVFPGRIENSLKFPAVKTGMSKTKTLNIKTTDVLSALTVAVTGSDAAMFTVSTSSITNSAANAANGTNIKVVYAPTAKGSHTATLTISGGGLNPDKVISLTGEGL